MSEIYCIYQKTVFTIIENVRSRGVKCQRYKGIKVSTNHGQRKEQSRGKLNAYIAHILTQQIHIANIWDMSGKYIAYIRGQFHYQGQEEEQGRGGFKAFQCIGQCRKRLRPLNTRHDWRGIEDGSSLINSKISLQHKFIHTDLQHILACNTY